PRRSDCEMGWRAPARDRPGGAGEGRSLRGERRGAVQPDARLPALRSKGRAAADLPAQNSIPVRSDADIVVARQKGRELAAALGFGPTDLTLIATAISELARNIVLYAKRGRIVLKGIERNSRRG